MHPDREGIARSPASGASESEVEWLPGRPTGAQVAGLMSCLDAVYGYALRMTGGEAGEAARIVESTYARARREAFPGTEGDTLIRLLAVCHELIEKTARGRDVESRVGARPVQVSAVPGGRTEVIRRPEFGAGILAEVDRLPPELRAPVALKDLQGLRYGEIAAVLRQPESVVRERLFHGRAVLQARVMELAQQTVEGRRRVV